MELETPTSSALIKLLRQSGRARPRSLGFGRDRDDEKQPAALVLVAQVDGLDAAAARSAVEAGAAAVAFTVGATDAADAGRLGEAVAACGAAAPGVVFGPDAELSVDLPAKLAEAKIDFLIASVHRAPAALLGEEKIARIPAIDASHPPALVRALGDMDVDALCVSPPRRRRNAGELTVYDLMHYRGVAELARPPILVVAEQTIRPEDLQALRDVGVDGLVLPLARFGGQLSAFRDAVAKVKIQRRRAAAAEDRGGAFLPRSLPAAASGGGDDDDDDHVD